MALKTNKKGLKICVFLFLIVFFSCKESKTQDKINYKTTTLTIKRGAFHYDTFVLKDSVIYFQPNKEQMIGKFSSAYTKASHKVISSATKKKLINHILQADFMKLEAKYPCKSSCTSMLEVSLTINGKTKTVQAEDYQRDCPKLLQWIEKEIIKLHGKDLYRSSLPG